MISHEHRCIFIHIPRTAGTNIERWLVGDDWWEIEPETKHLLASQARRLYAEYWDDYFKFSIVRDPVDRMISCLVFAKYFGLAYSRDSGFSFDGYHENFGSDIVIENDHRFSQRSALLTEKHQPQSVFGNLLDEPLDFVGRYENLESDLTFVQRAIGKEEAFGSNWNIRQDRKLPISSIGSADRDYIENLFKADLERFSLSC